MADNYFADWTSQDDEERKLAAWRALAGGDQAPHRSMANQVQLPELDIVGRPAADAPPPSAAPDVQPGTDAAKSPELPPDAPALAKVGAALRSRDEAPAPPDSLPADKPATSSGGNNVSPWALIADLALNRGRGIGSILALSASEGDKAQLQAAELDLKRAQAEHLRNPHANDDPAMLAYRQAMLSLQQQREGRLVEQGSTRADLTRTNIDNTEKRFETHRQDVGSLDSQFNQTQIAKSGLQAAATAQGRINAEHGLNDTVASDKAQIAGAESAARIGAGHDLAPLTAADEAAKAAAVITAQSGPKLDYERSLTPIVNERSNLGTGQGMDAESFIASNPNIHFDDPSQVQRAFKTRGINRVVIDKADAANRGNGIIQGLHDIADKYDSLPATEKAAPSGYGFRQAYDGLADEYAGVMIKLSGESSMEAKHRALAQVPSIHLPHQYLSEGIANLWTPIETNAAGALRSIGGTPMPPRFIQEQQARAAAMQPPPSAAVAPPPGLPPAQASGRPARGDFANYSHDGNVTEALGGGAARPLPADARQTRKRVTVHTPQGDEQGDLTQDEIRQFRAKGFRVD